MKLLLHTCCAPCSVHCIDSLKAENIDTTMYWYNPNIHPYTEYKSRKDTLESYVKQNDILLVTEDNYGLREFINNCRGGYQPSASRCPYCYKERLEKTAIYAKENGYTAFSTTLLISPYQNHEQLKLIGEELAKNHDIEFLYRDFRVGFRQGQAKARELGLYMQKYCGCIFSEEERYMKR